MPSPLLWNQDSSREKGHALAKFTHQAVVPIRARLTEENLRRLETSSSAPSAEPLEEYRPSPLASSSRLTIEATSRVPQMKRKVPAEDHQLTQEPSYANFRSVLAKNKGTPKKTAAALTYGSRRLVQSMQAARALSPAPRRKAPSSLASFERDIPKPPLEAFPPNLKRRLLPGSAEVGRELSAAPAPLPVKSLRTAGALSSNPKRKLPPSIGSFERDLTLVPAQHPVKRRRLGDGAAQVVQDQAGKGEKTEKSDSSIASCPPSEFKRLKSEQGKPAAKPIVR